MGATDVARRLLAGLTVMIISAGCAGSANPAPTSPPVSTPGPVATAAASATAAPPPTPASQAPTIGQPADDGARIIAVDTNPPVIHCSDTSCSTPTAVPATRARDLTIDSPAVGGIVQVRLLLPSRFDAQPSTRWPVLYLLHGGGGTYSEWTNYMDAGALTAPTDLLVVMPDGGAGWYSDWWGGNGGPPKWETFHLVELRQLLERNWHAGQKRAIAGFSMGGYGAMEYAARQPGMFLFAGSYSGPLDPLHGTVVFPFLIGDKWGDPVAQADVWRAHDPTANAAALKGTALYVAYGNGQVGPLDNGQVSPADPDGSTEREIGAEGAAFVKRLGELKIPVTV